jgi:hypothetical protein
VNVEESVCRSCEEVLVEVEWTNTCYEESACRT